MTTMKDIANAVGVSQSTVSRVINGVGNVDPELATKIKNYANQTNYQPNAFARSLVGAKTYLIGLIVPDIENPYFASLIKALKKEASKNGYTLLLFDSDNDIQNEEKYITVLTHYKVDGLFLVPCNNTHPNFLKLSKSTLPLVVVTQNVKNFSSVSLCHEKGGSLVASHLINQGYDSFIYVYQRFCEKGLGFATYLDNHNFELGRNYFPIVEAESDNEIGQFVAFLKELSLTQSVGIFCHNDMAAFRYLQILQQHNFSIPNRIGLVGFDDLFFCSGLSPSLSSVHQPLEQISIQAFTLLLNKINNLALPSVTNIVVEPLLHIRESSRKSDNIR